MQLLSFSFKAQPLRLIGVCILVALFHADAGLAYTVRGRLKNLTCFYPKVYLAVINSIDGFYSTSSQEVIAAAPVDSNGNFTITGNDLPDEPRFFRLYVTDNEASNASIYVGKKRNYIFLTLDNRSDVVIDCENFCVPFFSYTIGHSLSNSSMAAMQYLLISNDSLMRASSGESKKMFLEGKRYPNLKQFADTCKNLLAGLWAVKEMNVDSTFNKDRRFLESFTEKFAKEANAPQYARQLEENVKLLQYQQQVNEFHASTGLFTVVCVLLFCSLLANIFLMARRKQQRTEVAGQEMSPETEKEKITGLIGSLTIREREILKMIHEGLSNKEIAARLHVEVSTTKTHVSSIYQKTGIKNRKEVAGIARYH